MKSLQLTTILLLFSVIVFVSCEKSDNEVVDENKEYPASEFDNNELNADLTYGKVSDIEGNEYPTIKIGNRIWMAENLKTTKYNDGSEIPNVLEPSEWNTTTSGAWAVYDNDMNNNTLFGKLYNWYAVETGKLCPHGWHIPTDTEWDQLNDFLDPSTGVKMKSVGNIDDGTGLWLKSDNPEREGTNESGFTGLPGGFRFYDDDAEYRNMGRSTFWWSSTAYTEDDVEPGSASWARQAAADGNLLGPGYYYNILGASCRCVKDE